MTVEELLRRGYAGAYWSARPESLDSAADRMLSCLVGLSSVDGMFARWFDQESPGSGVALDAAAIVRLLRRGQNRAEDDGSPIDALGYTIGLWNGSDDAPVQLMATIGANRKRVVQNAVALRFDPASEIGELFTIAQARQIVDVMVDAFEPNWATLSTTGLRNLQGWTSGKPVVGWLTYLAAGVVRSRPMPTVGAVERRGDGSLIIVAADSGKDIISRVPTIAATVGTYQV